MRSQYCMYYVGAKIILGLYRTLSGPHGHPNFVSENKHVQNTFVRFITGYGLRNKGKEAVIVLSAISNFLA
jgi:hypothetical protein